jgi:hypothetical protein
MTQLTYNSYFNKLPKIQYDMNRSIIDARHETVTDIFFRVRIIREVLNNIDSYYVVELEDGETPEIVAEKVYDDAGAGWMILIANQIIDPQFEWPMGYDAFNKYMINKYGSVEAAETTVHHYDMVITRELQPDNVISETRFEVNGNKLTDNNLGIPYNYYYPHWGDPGSLATVQSVETFNVSGKTVTVTTHGEIVYAYDHDYQLNEDRRMIKVIKKEYHQQIMDEFNELTGAFPTFKRFVK